MNTEDHQSHWCTVLPSNRNTSSPLSSSSSVAGSALLLPCQLPPLPEWEHHSSWDQQHRQSDSGWYARDRPRARVQCNDQGETLWREHTAGFPWLQCCREWPTDLLVLRALHLCLLAAGIGTVQELAQVRTASITKTCVALIFPSQCPGHATSSVA